MGKKIFIISSSFRPHSNSRALCEAVADGAREAGNAVEIVNLSGKKISFCTGCYACQKLHHCVQNDDANEICRKICEADAVVFGTPVYYFGIAAQLKAVLDRCVQFWPEPAGKPYYLVATMADAPHFEYVIGSIKGFVECFDGATLAGTVLADGVYEQDAVRTTKFMKEAYELGKSI
ncbi:MAG: flavodoxin family protein [Opitutales bacterium]|nr:flavodoxin family protein [Opitutales bacterium]